MRSPEFVVTKWDANNEPVDEQGNYVRIIGRRHGLLAFILALFRIEPRLHLLISGESIKLTTSSLFGTQTRVLPLENCCSTYYGYKKPLWESLGILLLMIFIGSGAWNADYRPVGICFWVLAPLAAIAYYLLNKSITLCFVEMSGIINNVAFRGSAIEGFAIDENTAAYVITLTQALIDERVTARAIANPPTN